MPSRTEPQQELPREGNTLRSGRRGFLRILAGGAGIVTAATLVGCEDDASIVDPDPDTDPDPTPVSLGTGDAAVLNYAYALEQLEAAFYTMAVDNMFSGATDEEMRVLTALRNHEIVHREFYKNALLAGAIPALEVDFSSVDFDSRESVLQTAMTFEDLGVSAYNGAGRLLERHDLLTIAGKIVSVEARHAAAVRDLLQPMSAFFAGDDIVDENGLGLVRTPSEVLQAAAPFIVTPIDASGLPTA